MPSFPQFFGNLPTTGIKTARTQRRIMASLYENLQGFPKRLKGKLTPFQKQPTCRQYLLKTIKTLKLSCE